MGEAAVRMRPKVAASSALSHAERTTWTEVHAADRSAATVEVMTDQPHRLLTARLHDGSVIEVYTAGDGPPILLPVRVQPYDEETAATMRAWGADPESGPTLVAGLADTCTVIAADYEGHRMQHPAPDTLTAGTIVDDLLSIADAVTTTRFTVYGYSWLGLAAYQLALRSNRVNALAMGGFPPVHGPYGPMLAVTTAAHEAALAKGSEPEPAVSAAEITPGDWDSATIQADEAQTRQFLTLYLSLQNFDDAAAATRLTVPRLCFVGELDNIDYPLQWGDTRVAIADAVIGQRKELTAAGWAVKILPGLDHISAMKGDTVLAVLRDWWQLRDADCRDGQPSDRAGHQRTAGT